MILSSKRSVDESLYKEVLPNFFVRSILNLKPIFCGLTLATFDVVAVLDAAIQKCFVVNLNMLYSIEILERVYLLMKFYIHCVKSVRFGVVLVRIFPYSVQKPENTDQNNSEY